MILSWQDIKKHISIKPICIIFILTLLIIIAINTIRWTPPILRGVSELISVDINGSQQWLLIRGQKKDAPIILFLHGGPGNAQIGVFRHYQRELEKNYIVVQWDQRGSGLSGANFPSRSTLNLQQFIEDGISVTKYLKTRFNKEKIYLVGHAEGTGLGWFMARDYPEHFYAYAAFNQIAVGNQQTYQYVAVLAAAEQRKKQKAIIELKDLGAPPWKFMPPNPEKQASQTGYATMLKVLKWAKAFQGEAYHQNISHIFARDFIFSTEYTIQDIFNWRKTKHQSMNMLYSQFNANLRLIDIGASFKIPFYMFLGENDLLTPVEPALELFSLINAVDKQILIYPDTSHYIFWERTIEYQLALKRFFNKH
ncbi:MAG: alpha/beta hydrolase family protein [Brevinema sp.]